jgi:phosphotransferase system  glucose/maltose/N-acetylglucosamine-specific IIC component
MRIRHSLFEILRFPLEVLFVAAVLLGIGNLLSNPVFGIAGFINNDYAELFAEILIRTGQFLIANFPLFFMIRLVSRKTGSATTVISAAAGYAVFLVTTMYLANGNLPDTAFSSILGISISSTSVESLSASAHYPLQTGIFGPLLISFISLSCYTKTKKKDEYGILGFIAPDTTCTILTLFWSFIAGIAFSFAWPFIIYIIEDIISFISVDTTNPVNLSLYGILNRLLGVMNLGALIRQPFWYTSAGGTWTSMSGTAIEGDVNVWTAQLSGSVLTSQAGRFFTPYYVLNIFAMPALIWAMYSLYTDKAERRRIRIAAILATFASLLTGSLLPLEIVLLLLCPLLFAFHLAYTGFLYGLMQGLHIYLGYNSTGTSTLTALPGTLPEMLSYLSHPALQKSLIGVLIIGLISAAVYFAVTRFYFRYLAADVFKTGEKEALIQETMEAAGGIENIRLTQSSISRLTLSLYEPDKLQIDKLRSLGIFRIYETRAGVNICLGASSTMVKNGIDQAMRNATRTVNTDSSEERQ